MVALASLTVSEQLIEFSPFKGIVEDVQSWTNTQVWSEGGGGYVFPQYGGWVQAPTIRSRSVHNLRVRILWENGKRSTIDLPGNVQLCANDKVVCIACENTLDKVWQWAGVANLTTNTWFGFGEFGNVAKIKAKGIVGNLGHILLVMIVTGNSSSALTKMLAAIIILGILSAILTIPCGLIIEFVWHLTVHSMRPPGNSLLEASTLYFFPIFGMVLITSIFGMSRLSKQIRQTEAEFIAARTRALNAALGQG